MTKETPGFVQYALPRLLLLLGALTLALTFWFGGDATEKYGDLRAMDPGEPALAVWLDGPVSDGGGSIAVQLSVPGDSTVDLPEPEVKGLVFVEQGEARVETLGDRRVITRKYKFSGNRNAYELPPLVAKWAKDGQKGELTSHALWIDMGVEAPEVGEFQEIADPRPVWPVPWRLLFGGVGFAMLVAGTMLYQIRPVPVVPRRVVKLRPDVRALKQWDQVRADATMDDLQRTVELSRIFREYAEATLDFPAARWTTTETLAKLTALPHLPEGNLPRARRLLQATDLVKFAEQAIEGRFFEDLDSDLRAFISSTRKHSWDDAR